MEGSAFPSDQYAAATQAQFHGYSPAEAIIEAQPRPDEFTLRTEDLLDLIEREGSSIAMVLLGDVNNLTGQAFDIAAIAKAARAKGCRVGLNLAHGAGNVVYQLHDWDVDFAVWCGYLETLLKQLPQGIAEIITPRDPAQRGAQLSIKVSGNSSGARWDRDEAVAGPAVGSARAASGLISATANRNAAAPIPAANVESDRLDETMAHTRHAT